MLSYDEWSDDLGLISRYTEIIEPDLTVIKFMIFKLSVILLQSSNSQPAARLAATGPIRPCATTRITTRPSV